jgi:hypothetical protein
MSRVDMSPEAITTRLRLMSHLRDFCMALGKGRIIGPVEETSDARARPRESLDIQRPKELEDASG